MNLAANIKGDRLSRSPFVIAEAGVNHEGSMKIAKQLIDESPMMKVTEVCLQSGFGDLSHFEKMFKRNVGCTPRQYRQKEREKARLFATN